MPADHDQQADAVAAPAAVPHAAPFAFAGRALDRFAQRGTLRRHRVVEAGGDGGWVMIAGRRVLQLASNNYLGLATHARVVEAACEAARMYGAGAGASPLVTGYSPVHHELCETIAALKGQEAALVYVSGYATNVGVLTALAGPRDRVFADALNHASLIDGCRQSHATVRLYRHGDVDQLDGWLTRDASNARGRRLVVTDSVFSMDGDCAPLRALADIARHRDALLVVDDAHGTGVLGPDGAGAVAAMGLGADDVAVHVGTLSKAIGCQGGFVAGSRVLIDYLLNTSRAYIFSTAIAPAIAAAALEALRVLRDEPWRQRRLADNARTLRAALRDAGFTLAGQLDLDDGDPRAALVTPILPVLVGDPARAVAFADALLERGVLAPAIRPPAVPEGSSRVRVTVMATHTDDELALAVDAIVGAGRAVGLVPTSREGVAR